MRRTSDWPYRVPKSYHRTLYRYSGTLLTILTLGYWLYVDDSRLKFFLLLIIYLSRVFCHRRVIVSSRYFFRDLQNEIKILLGVC
jgi:hypothetical protein